MFLHQNHGAGGGNGSVMVRMFVCLCLASKKPSERECFVPARTDLLHQGMRAVEYPCIAMAIEMASKESIFCIGAIRSE